MIDETEKENQYMGARRVNPYNAEIFVYKPWRPKGFLIGNHHKCLR